MKWKLTTTLQNLQHCKAYVTILLLNISILYVIRFKTSYEHEKAKNLCESLVGLNALSINQIGFSEHVHATST